MIILDTNVLSALMQQQPDSAVVDWLDAQPTEAIWICSIINASPLILMGKLDQLDLIASESKKCAHHAVNT